MSEFSWRRAVACAVVGLVVAGTLQAQEPAGIDPVRSLETRAMLLEEAQKAEAAHRTGEAFLLRSRLLKGDFQEGDRIVITLLGTLQFNDTITVRAGKQLQLPKMESVPLSLDGVLRSELTGKVSSHLAIYLKDSSARVTPLLRLGIMGEIGRPGYYYTSADVLINDMIMKAGGPGQTSDLDNVVVRRGGEVIWNADATRVALSDGISLDRLHLRAGDEILIGQRSPPVNWLTILQISGSVIGTLFALVSIRSRF